MAPDGKSNGFKLLGLDVSTSCVGVCLLSRDENKQLSIEKLDAIVLKEDTLLAKAVEFSNKIEKIISGCEIDLVCIEDAAKKFASGRSSADTIATLLRFNGIVSYIVFDRYKKRVEYISPSEARKLVGLKVQRVSKCGISHKKQTFDYFMARDLSSQVWPLKKSGEPKDFVFDTVDAYCIAKAGQLKFSDFKKT